MIAWSVKLAGNVFALAMAGHLKNVKPGTEAKLKTQKLKITTKG
jgi:hypothetical protein